MVLLKYSLLGHNLSDRAGLYAWVSSRDTLLGRVKQKAKEEFGDDNGNKGLTTDKIIEIIEGKSRLICISISDPFTIKELIMTLSREFL